MRKILMLQVVLIAGILASCSKSEGTWKREAENPEFLHRAIKQVTDVIVHDIFSPPVASRIYAYSSIAGYEVAMHGDTSRYVSLAGQVNGLDSIPQPEKGQEYCFSLAATQAVLKIGRTLVFSEDKMDDFYAVIMKDFRDTGMPEEVYDRSVAYGDQVASRILKWSSKDNYKQSRSFPKYSILDDPATWKPTPPAYMDAVEPHWNKIRPFAIDSAQQFRPTSPTPFSTKKNTPFYNEALKVKHTGDSLTAEQRDITFFWDCNPFVMNVKGHVMFATKKISPGGHWMNITRIACRKVKADYIQSAEAYARVAISLVDGFISCWDEKYRSKLIRPETYINQYIDETWIPTLQTPPFPEYPSGHSVISSAAAVNLTKIFGDNFAFTDSTEIDYGLTSRSFNSFIKAADEAAISRVYGGIHYMPACVNGVNQGRALGAYVAEKLKTRKK